MIAPKICHFLVIFGVFLVYLPSWLVRVGEGLRGEGESAAIFVFY